MRKVSINARRNQQDRYATDLEVVLIHISHNDLDSPVRLSTDPTTRLSVEPLAYGTRSTWRTTDGSPFLFVLASALLPDDQDDAPPTATLIIDGVANEITEILRSTRKRASVRMAVVLASSPDHVEAEFTGLELVGVDGGGSQVTLHLSGEAYHLEPWPAARMTKARFPGLFS